MKRLAVPFTVSLLTFALGVCSANVIFRTDSPAFTLPADSVAAITQETEPEIDDDWEEYFGTPLVWTFLMSDEEYGHLAVVRSAAESANGKVKAKLKLNCPSQNGSIEVLVGDMEQTGFNLKNYSLKSEQPVLKTNKVEVRALTGERELSYTTRADAFVRYSNLKPTVVFFELNRTRGLERTIAEGGTEVEFTIYDLETNDRKLVVTFPEIEVSNDMVKELNGCRASKKR